METPTQPPALMSSSSHHDMSISDLAPVMEMELCTCDPPDVECDDLIPGRSVKKRKRDPSSASNSPKNETQLLSKTGKPILLASAKRQLRRQKQHAKAEPKYIELADGQQVNLGKRRSKYAALLEKLNQDLVRVQLERVEQKQLNNILIETNQTLQQQLNVAQELQSQLVQLPQTKSQLMQPHASNVCGFFKMSSPVMILLQDFNLRIIDANAAYLSEHGWTRSEIIGRRLPLMQMAIFFIPGYDSKLIPVDDTDIPPLHAGLPRGIGPDQLYGNPANYSIYHNLFRGKIDTATVREISLDAKGRLFKTTITYWLAYYNGESSFDPIISSTASQPFLSRPQTCADDAYRTLIGIQPPFHPAKGYPKYYVSMESAYDREYIRPSPNTRLWDSLPVRGSCTFDDDGEMSRKMSWSGPYLLKDVAKLAEHVATRRQANLTGYPNVVGMDTRFYQHVPLQASHHPHPATSSSLSVKLTTPMSSPKPIVTTSDTPTMSPTNSVTKRKCSATFTSTTPPTTSRSTSRLAFLGKLPRHFQRDAAVALAANRAQQMLQQAQAQARASPYSPIPLNIPPHAVLPPNPDHAPLLVHATSITASPFENSFTSMNIPFSSDLHAPAVAAPW